MDFKKEGKKLSDEFAVYCFHVNGDSYDWLARRLERALEEAYRAGAQGGS